MKIGVARPDEPEDALEQCWRGAILGSLEGYRDEEWGIFGRARPEPPPIRSLRRQMVRDALLADPLRSDHQIAARVGCSIEPVRFERTALIAAGAIPDRRRRPEKKSREKQEKQPRPERVRPEKQPRPEQEKRTPKHRYVRVRDATEHSRQTILRGQRIRRVWVELTRCTSAGLPMPTMRVLAVRCNLLSSSVAQACVEALIKMDVIVVLHMADGVRNGSQPRTAGAYRVAKPYGWEIY